MIMFDGWRTVHCKHTLHCCNFCLMGVSMEWHHFHCLTASIKSRLLYSPCTLCFLRTFLFLRLRRVSLHVTTFFLKDYGCCVIMALHTINSKWTKQRYYTRTRIYINMNRHSHYLNVTVFIAKNSPRAGDDKLFCRPNTRVCPMYWTFGPTCGPTGALAPMSLWSFNGLFRSTKWWLGCPICWYVRCCWKTVLFGPSGRCCWRTALFGPSGRCCWKTWLFCWWKSTGLWILTSWWLGGSLLEPFCCL